MITNKLRVKTALTTEKTVYVYDTILEFLPEFLLPNPVTSASSKKLVTSR